MTSPDLSDLVPLLFDGVFEEPLWSGFLGRVRFALSADYVSLTFRPPSRPLNEVIHLYDGAAAPPPVSQLYHDHLYKIDPTPYFRLAEGEPQALEEWLRPGDPDHDSFYRDFLVPSGMTEMLFLRVMEPSGVNAWLIVSRHGDAPFGGAERGLMRALTPYLRSALRTRVCLEQERMKASLAAEAAGRLGFGWLTLDASARILDASSEGEALLAASGVLARDRSGRLTARSKPLDREIQGAVQALAADPRGRPRALVLSREPWLDMLLVPTKARSISARPDPQVVAYVHADSGASADRCDQLADLFVLTRAEARLALALSRGMSLTEAAADLGLTVETARNYSKKIYAKLGARGQSDVVRFVMRSVIAIA